MSKRNKKESVFQIVLTDSWFHDSEPVNRVSDSESKTPYWGMIGVVASLICVARVKYTGFWLYGLRIYGLFGFILVIWSMINQILVLNFSDIWSFRLYGQLCQDKTVDHSCINSFQPMSSSMKHGAAVQWDGRRRRRRVVTEELLPYLSISFPAYWVRDWVRDGQDRDLWSWSFKITLVISIFWVI